MSGSNWERILLNGQKYNLIIKPSTRKNKKAMLLNPVTNKWIHFGQKGYDDFTQSQDKKRLTAFRTRNKKWSEAEKYSPAWASYFILWN